MQCFCQLVWSNEYSVCLFMFNEMEIIMDYLHFLTERENVPKKSYIMTSYEKIIK